MDQNQLSQLSDEELLAKAKKMKSSEITHAVLIGFMVGIILFSILKNALGFFTLIPLFFIYKLTSQPKEENQALKALLKERNLK